MSDLVRLLKADGSIDELDAKSSALFTCLDGETDPATLSAANIQSDPLVVVFNGVADGRGFSLAKALLGNLEYQGKLFAAGYINPDQLSLAFQAGFHGVLVSADSWQDYGIDSWQAAMSPIVNLSYAATESQALQSIWQSRHSKQA